MSDMNENDKEYNNTDTDVSGVVAESDLLTEEQLAEILPPDDDDDDDNDDDESKKVSIPALLFDIVETLALATCAIVIVFVTLFRVAMVSGDSMNNTLFDKDVLIVSPFGFEPQYGDIVVFQKLESYLGEEAVVKRVIATEGQTVDIDFDTWTVTVDGVVIDESDYIYLARDNVITADYSFPITIGEGQLFVMGDNRNHSSDSRSLRIGIVDKRTVFGRVLVRISPITEFRIFGRES